MICRYLGQFRDEYGGNGIVIQPVLQKMKPEVVLIYPSKADSEVEERISMILRECLWFLKWGHRNHPTHRLWFGYVHIIKTYRGFLE